MSEPCRHERAASEAIGEALASLAASDAAMEMATTELLAKDAMVATKDAAIDAMAVVIVTRDATIERLERAESEHVPSAKAASILLDLLGHETFANETVKFVIAELDAVGVGPLSPDHRKLVQMGALKSAALVADEVREFARRT